MLLLDREPWLADFPSFGRRFDSHRPLKQITYAKLSSIQRWVATQIRGCPSRHAAVRGHEQISIDTGRGR